MPSVAFFHVGMPNEFSVPVSGLGQPHKIHPAKFYNKKEKPRLKMNHYIFSFFLFSRYLFMEFFPQGRDGPCVGFLRVCGTHKSQFSLIKESTRRVHACTPPSKKFQKCRKKSKLTHCTRPFYTCFLGIFG